MQGIVQKYELNRKWFYLYGEHSQAIERTHLCIATVLGCAGEDCAQAVMREPIRKTYGLPLD